jgi:hypothetical protein
MVYTYVHGDDSHYTKAMEIATIIEDQVYVVRASADERVYPLHEAARQEMLGSFEIIQGDPTEQIEEQQAPLQQQVPDSFR